MKKEKRAGTTQHKEKQMKKRKMTAYFLPFYSLGPSSVITSIFLPTPAPNLIEMLLCMRGTRSRGQASGGAIKAHGSLSLSACCRHKQISDLKGRQEQ